MHRMMRPMASVLFGTAAAAVFVTTLYGQSGQSILGKPSPANHFIETPAGWVHPKTPWGEPDIQAMLNMMQANSLTLERCFGQRNCDTSKAWLTEEEFAQRMNQYNNRVDQGRALIEQGNYGRALLSGVTDPNMPQRQTSLIVDPPNGRLPKITAEGKRRALQMGSSWSLPAEDTFYDDALDFDFWDNCRSRGMPSSMMPYRYNGGLHIMQAPGVVVLDLEMIHDSRIIYTDGRPALSKAHKQYMGESRGRWEGNTLVIETTNYKEGPPMINLAVPGSPAGNRFAVSDQMKTTERITRVNNDWYLYEIKTEDPVILEAPFTVRYPMKNDPSYQWWEYACHEGNTIVQGYSTTNKHEREHPDAEPEPNKAPVSADIANQLVGRWVGKPEIPTIGYNIEIEFVKNADGTVQGKLIGTDLKTFRGKVNPVINKWLRDFRIAGQPAPPGRAGGGGGGRGAGAGRGGGPPAAPNPRAMTWQFPNTQPWTFNGELSADGSQIVGVTNSAQGGTLLTFRKRG
jgi:hypothetical protein